MARRAVVDMLARHGCPPATRANAALVVSELVTNAVLHGQPPIALHARIDSGHLHVNVNDEAAGDLPHVRDIDWAMPGGRGLRIIEAIARHWGWTPTDSGKCVWAEVALGN